MKKQEQGALGEALARDFLESEGYRFIESNFLRRVGEIDLVMLAPPHEQHTRTIVFVEVRYRTSSRFGGAVQSIDWKKQRKLLRTANAWLQKHADSRDCARIDVFAIEPSTRKPREGERLWRNHHVRWLINAIESAT
ncbi:MAG: YraN family protein [Granulosicoccus sp.]